jgi:hypothetical protein
VSERAAEPLDFGGNLAAISDALVSHPDGEGSAAEAGRAALVLLGRDITRLQIAVTTANSQQAAADARVALVESQFDFARRSYEAQQGEYTQKIAELEREIGLIRDHKSQFLGEVGGIIHEYRLTLDGLAQSLQAKVS